MFFEKNKKKHFLVYETFIFGYNQKNVFNFWVKLY